MKLPDTILPSPLNQTRGLIIIVNRYRSGNDTFVAKRPKRIRLSEVMLLITWDQDWRNEAVKRWSDQ